MILSSAPGGFPGAWGLALAAVAAYVLAAFPGRAEGRRLPTALVAGVLLQVRADDLLTHLAQLHGCHLPARRLHMSSQGPNREL